MKVFSFWVLSVLCLILLSETRGGMSQGVQCGFIGQCSKEACEKICERSSARCVSDTNCCCLGSQTAPTKWFDPDMFPQQQIHQRT
ncbi:unnamed protein product [Amaranthus hypochondriacus]